MAGVFKAERGQRPTKDGGVNGPSRGVLSPLAPGAALTDLSGSSIVSLASSATQMS